MIAAFTFLILNEGPSFIDNIKKHLSKAQVAKWTGLCQEMCLVIRGYINGQITISLIGALFALIIMSLIGVQNAVAMALHCLFI